MWPDFRGIENHWIMDWQQISRRAFRYPFRRRIVHAGLDDAAGRFGWLRTAIKAQKTDRVACIRQDGDFSGNCGRCTAEKRKVACKNNIEYVASVLLHSTLTRAFTEADRGQIVPVSTTSHL